MSQGTSDSSSGSRGELPSQAGVGHSQTAKRGGRCWAGAGQETHQAAPATATAAAQCGKEGPGVPGAQIQGDRSLVTGSCPRSICFPTPPKALEIKWCVTVFPSPQLRLWLLSRFTLALGNLLHFVVHEFILGYTALHSSATIYSLVHPQKMHPFVSLSWRGSLHIRHPVLRRLPIYWPRAPKYWWFVSWWRHTSTTAFYRILYVQANSCQLIWSADSKNIKMLAFLKLWL